MPVTLSFLRAQVKHFLGSNWFYFILVALRPKSQRMSGAIATVGVPTAWRLSLMQRKQTPRDHSLAALSEMTGQARRSGGNEQRVHTFQPCLSSYFLNFSHAIPTFISGLQLPNDSPVFFVCLLRWSLEFHTDGKIDFGNGRDVMLLRPKEFCDRGGPRYFTFDGIQSSQLPRVAPKDSFGAAQPQENASQ